MAYQSKYTGLQIDDILDSVEWKQGKIEDLASIRAGAQKGATALQSYTEKYTGTVTGIKLNGVVKSGSGVIDLGTISTTETDPIFSASPAASITEAKKAEWDGKQDKIADLASIRSGAEKGATALQSIPSEYVTETELTNKGYATTSSLNNKVDKVNGKQLSTEDFTTALKTKLEGLSNYDDAELSEAIETLRGDFDNIVSGDTTTAIKTFNEVIAFLDGLTDTQDLESIIASIEQQIAGKMDKVTLATVATSGSYNDLSNKPTIPAAVTESTVSGWGFTKNTGTYSKPSGGIPKSDLASAVQTSLGKADTALQSYTEQYKGTITGVSANGTSVATSGVANIPAASTSAYGVTKLSSATNSTSTTLAATASAVKAAYDLANGKQDKLVSGTNIKTINGTSILGSGDITISGGGSSNANVKAVTYNFDDWMNEPIRRSCKDAVDLTTGEKIYFTGHADYIQCDGGMLIDYIDDKASASRIIKWDVEAGSVDYIPEEVMHWPFTQEGILILNGGVAIVAHNEDFSLTHIQSAVVKDDNIVVTKVFSIMGGYDSDLVTIDSYPISGSGGGSSSSGVNSISVNGTTKNPSGGVVDLGYINKQLVMSPLSTMTLSPNIYYRNNNTALSTLTITLGNVSNSNIINEYFVEFTTSSSGTTVSLPSTIKWANGETPTFEAGATYQISIVNNLGTIQKFK